MVGGAAWRDGCHVSVNDDRVSGEGEYMTLRAKWDMRLDLYYLFVDSE
jgi:hypothetical protein